MKLTFDPNGTPYKTSPVIGFISKSRWHMNSFLEFGLYCVDIFSHSEELDSGRK